MCSVVLSLLSVCGSKDLYQQGGRTSLASLSQPKIQLTTIHRKEYHHEYHKLGNEADTPCTVESRRDKIKQQEKLISFLSKK